MKSKKPLKSTKSKCVPKRIKTPLHVSMIIYEYIMPNVIQNGK